MQRPDSLRTMSPRVEALNSQLLSSKKLLPHVYNLNDCKHIIRGDADAQLRKLEKTLESFDIEKIYGTIQKDLEQKYQLAAEYYSELNNTRTVLLKEDKLDPVKEQHYKADLQKKLDQVRNTLRKDFSIYIDDYYTVCDALFLMHTNTCSQKDLDNLEQKVSICQKKADKVYNEEYLKIYRIYELLDNEGLRLNKALDAN